MTHYHENPVFTPYYLPPLAYINLFKLHTHITHHPQPVSAVCFRPLLPLHQTSSVTTPFLWTTYFPLPKNRSWEPKSTTQTQTLHGTLPTTQGMSTWRSTNRNLPSGLL
ncbi:hypothetical protein ACTXT7_010393 [Hymenolepis weldensis]